MFYTGAAVELRERTFVPIVGVSADTDVQVPDADEHRDRLAAERAVDNALADSFPASDPPSWTLGIASPQPPRAATDKPLLTTEQGDTEISITEDVIDVSRPGEGRTLLQGLWSVVGATGLALLVPLVILLVGLPIALAVRGIIVALAWFGARIFG